MAATKILVVDDSHDHLKQLTQILESANYQVLITDTSKSAIEISRYSKPDMILIDVNLAHEDGIELCKELRNESFINRPLILLISSVSHDEETRVRGFDAGADDFIHRPISKKELLAKIEAEFRSTANSKKLIGEVQSQDNLWNIINKSHVIIFVWRNDDRLPVEYVSENITQFGYTPREFLSGSLHFHDIVFKEDLQKVIHTFHVNLNNEITEFKEIYRIITKDGKIRWIEDFTQIYKRDLNGITHLQGIIIDITDTRAAQESQRESEIRYFNLLETMNDGLIQVDNDDKILFANRKFLELTGYRLDEIKNKISHELFIYPEDKEKIINKNLDRIKGLTDSYQVKIRKKDGTAVWVSISAAPVRNQNGKIIGSTGVISDITQIKSSQDRLKFHSTILQNVHDSIIGFDLSGKINYWNIGAENFYGYTFHDVQDKSINEIFHDDVYKNLSSILKDSEFELKRKRINGEMIITNSRVTQLNDGKGNIIGYLEVSKNITDERTAQNEKTLLQKLINEISAAPNIDEAFRIVIQSVCEFANWSIGEVWIPNEVKDGFVLAASYAADINFEPVINNVKNKTLKMDRGLIGEVWNTGKAICIDDMSKQKYFSKVSPLQNAGINCALGIPISEKRVSIAVLEFFGHEKKVFNENLISFVSSIASQLASALKSKEAEAARNLAVQKFQKIFENSSEGIFQFDTNNDFIIFNPAFYEQLGYITAQEFLESFRGKINDLFVDQSVFAELMEKTNSENFVSNFSCELKSKDGSTLWASLNLTKIISSGSNIFYEGLYGNITPIQLAKIELQRAKEKAEEMVEFKNQLLANMSHEFRTPMIGIIGYAEVLIDEIENESHQVMLEAIHSSGQRLLETLSLVLELAKIEANKSEIHIRPLDIARIITNCFQKHKTSAEKEKLSFSYQMENENLIVETDEGLLYKVLNYIVSNAIKFTKKGSVKIRSQLSKDKAGWYEIDVIDTGIGIAPENLAKIFDDFRQASEGLSRSFEGVGLGLSVSKKVVKLLGGNIFVTSKLNEGSTFTVTFPIKKNE